MDEKRLRGFLITNQIICDANEDLLTLMHAGILPLLKNVEEMIEKIILTMHNEDFSSQDKNQLPVNTRSGITTK